MLNCCRFCRCLVLKSAVHICIFAYGMIMIVIVIRLSIGQAAVGVTAAASLRAEVPPMPHLASND